VDVDVAPDTDPKEFRRIAASLEAASEHPVARAISGLAEPGDVSQFINHAGFGVTGVVDGRAAVIGRPHWVREQGITVPEQPESAVGTRVAVGWDGTFRGAITVADTVKTTSKEAVAGLTLLGLTPHLLTGDNEAVARAVAAEVGIEQVRAAATPEGKLAYLQELRANGHTVAMVGDGINDAAALAAADLGIAMGTGTDVAMAASDLTLVHGDLATVVDAVQLSRATLRTIKGNLFWAFAYNVAAIPLAALGVLNPMIAGLTMAFSSVFVVTNSLRLRRFGRTTSREASSADTSTSGGPS
jgi:Cu+-exporting ATPase